MAVVLVVDDSSTVRQQLKVFLENLGHTVLEAENGQRGLDIATEHPEIQLFTIDVNMPVMNGIDMIKGVRKLADHQKTPVFMLTTESGKDTMLEAKAAGVTAWIVKPFKPEFLMKGIQKVLG